MMNRKLISNRYQIIGLVGLIVIGILGRFLLVGFGLQPFPNFEIIMVLTFLAAMLFHPSIAICVPVIGMIGSDLLIGNPIFVGDQMNQISLFTYSGFALIALLNIFNRNRLWKAFGEFRLKTIGLAAGLGIGFVLLYDIWTNVGWWYILYPHNASSLATVFTAGLPFMIYHVLSGAVTFIAIGLPILVYASKKTTLALPFSMKTVQKLPVVIAVVCLVALSFTGTAVNVPAKSEIWLEHTDQTSVRLGIAGDGWIITDNIIAYSGDTVLSVLERSAAKNDFSVKYTYYEQFDSTLIDSINKVVNGQDGKYWQYYLNGEYGSIPAEKQLISNGDIIEWRFEAFS